MTVFDLSEIQAQYILDMPLRRLTRYDRLELEREQDELRAEIAALTAILERTTLLRKVVSDELAEVAKKFGTPRRTVLLEAARGGRRPPRSRSRWPTTRAWCCCRRPAWSPGWPSRPRMIPNGPWFLPRPTAARAAHDVIVSAVRATARGTVGAGDLRRAADQAQRARAARAAARRRRRCRWPGARR